MTRIGARAALAQAALVCGLCALPVPALCEVSPQPGPGDPHIQTVLYDPEQVVALHVSPGYALTVLLSPDERIETVTVGDSAGWQVAVDHAADRLVVKPQGNGQTTNMTVISDQRTYNFSLYAGFGGGGAQAYTVRFTYPLPPTEQAALEPAPVGRYKLHGARALWPAEISDDGTLTSIRWERTATFPAVYRDDGEGMALVNGVVRNGVYQIEGAHRQLIFLLGKERATATRIKPKDKPAQ